MINKIPDDIVHYSRGEPFRSITSLRGEHLNLALKNLNESNAWGLARLADSFYLCQRRQVELEMRARFVGMGGKPILENPIYFFLGRHPGFEEDKRNIRHMISLQDIDPLTISFSYGDSMLCFHEGNRILGGEKYQSPHCTNLYSLRNLSQLYASESFPATSALHIEAHLWVTPDLRTVKRIE